MQNRFLPCLALLFLAGCGGRAVSHGDPGQPVAPPTPSASLPPSQRPGPAHADPNDVWLAFEASRPSTGIFAMRADGSQLHEIKTGLSEAGSPAFSANGQALAFAGPGGIYVVDLALGPLWERDDTSRGIRQITHGRDRAPAWSPDGKFVAFMRDDLDIWIVNADGTNERLLVKGPVPGKVWYEGWGHPVFTKDGQSILFDWLQGIDMVNVDGANHRPLYGAGNSVPMVGLSPDGTRVAFSCGCSGSGLCAVPIESVAAPCSGPKFEHANIEDARPAWGTNGLIAYTSLGDLDVWVVPETGGAPKNIMTDANKVTTGGGYVSEVAWSPPGTVLP